MPAGPKGAGAQIWTKCYDVVQALKLSVTDGPKIRAGDNAALLDLSDKIENCCCAMVELHSGDTSVIVCQVTCKGDGEGLQRSIGKEQMEGNLT